MYNFQKLLASFCLCMVLVCRSEGRATIEVPSADDTICFDGECFSNQPPYNNTDGLLPQRPDFIQTTFRLYHGTNTSNPDLLEVNNTVLLNQSHFNPELPTKFIIHGFLQHARVHWVILMASELLNREASNVISVDWGHGSGFPYSQASANTRAVGYEVNRLIQFLQTSAGLRLDTVHLIGHSLGAHVAGYAGMRTKTLARITGLDPAQPDFDGTEPDVRLDQTDANFVDVIHTDGSDFDYVSGFGMMTAVGHVDFYPNGGEYQPGCPRQNVENFMSRAYYDGLEDAEDILSCSHSRSIYLFIESIRSRCQFQAYPCSSLDALDNNKNNCMGCRPAGCPSMGYNANRTPNLSGRFYLRTRHSRPFCGYSQQVDVQFGSDMTTSADTVRVQLITDDQTSDTINIQSENGPFSRGQHVDTVWVDSNSMDDVREVRLTFRQSTDSHWWFHYSYRNPEKITVAMVTVYSVRNRRRVFFCGDGQAVVNGKTLILTRSSTDPQDCSSIQETQQGIFNIF